MGKMLISPHENLITIRLLLVFLPNNFLTTLKIFSTNAIRVEFIPNGTYIHTHNTGLDHLVKWRVSLIITEVNVKL